MQLCPIVMTKSSESDRPSSSATTARVHRLATDDEHLAHCPFNWKDCSRCLWMQNDGFKNSLTKFTDGRPSPFKDKLQLGIKFAPCWGVACEDCFLHEKGSGRGFAKGDVASLDVLHHMKQHLKGKRHQQNAAKAVLGAAPLKSDRQVDGNVVIQQCTAPVADRWCWAVETCHAHGSYRSYRQFAQRHSTKASGVMCDSSPESCAKMITCLGDTCRLTNVDFIKNSVRAAFSMDDKDITFVTRLKLVSAMPKIRVRHCLGGVIKSLPADVPGAADKIMQALEDACFVRTGKRSHCKSSSGPLDGTDEVAWAKLKSIVFSGASDGASTMLDAVQKIKIEKKLPRLRYQFRDVPHTVRTCVKGTVKHCILGNEVVEVLISGPGSFCKRIKYCPAMKAAWVAVQLEDAVTEDMFTIFVEIGYGEHRFDSRSRPMSIICCRINVVLKILKKVSLDTKESHRETQKWACCTLRFLSGRQGFVLLVIFAAEADFHCVAHVLVRLSDVSCQDREISLSDTQCVETMEILKALLWEGRLFSSEAAATYTYEMLSAIQKGCEFWFGKGEKCSLWPGKLKEMETVIIHGRSLYQMCLQFFAVNFPDYSARSHFKCWDFGPTALPHDAKLDLIEQIALRENCCPRRSRLEFDTMLYQAKSLYAEYGNSDQVAIAMMEQCRTKDGGFRKDRECFIKIGLSKIGLMDLSADCERTLGRISMLDIGSRANNLGLHSLSDALSVAMHIPRHIDALVWREHKVKNSKTNMATVTESWRPKVHILSAMEKYKEFYGERALASRKIECVVVPMDKDELDGAVEVRAKSQRLQSVGPGSKDVQMCKLSGKKVETVSGRKRKWSATVMQLTKDMCEGKPVGKSFIGTDMPPMCKRSKIKHVHDTLRKLNQLKESSKEQAAKDEASHGLARPPRPLDPPRRKKETLTSKIEAFQHGVKLSARMKAFARCKSQKKDAATTIKGATPSPAAGPKASPKKSSDVPVGFAA